MATKVNISGVNELDFPVGVTASISAGVTTLSGLQVITPVLTPGYFWGGISDSSVIDRTVNQSAGWTVNQCFVSYFYIPFQITITRITIYVVAVSASASQFFSAGIYSTAGAKLIDSGTFDVSSGQSTGVRSNTISPVTITPGFYYYAMTTNSVDTDFIYFGSSDSTLARMSNNGSNTRTAKGSATTNGALNSTLGSLTAVDTTVQISALFEP